MNTSLLTSGISRRTSALLTAAVAVATASMLTAPVQPSQQSEVQPTTMSATPKFNAAKSLWYADLASFSIASSDNATISAINTAASRVPNQRNTVKLRASVEKLAIVKFSDMSPVNEAKVEVLRNHLLSHIDGLSDHVYREEFGRSFSHTGKDESAASALYSAIRNSISNKA